MADGAKLELQGQPGPEFRQKPDVSTDPNPVLVRKHLVDEFTGEGGLLSAVTDNGNGARRPTAAQSGSDPQSPPYDAEAVRPGSIGESGADGLPGRGCARPDSRYDLEVAAAPRGSGSDSTSGTPMSPPRAAWCRLAPCPAAGTGGRQSAGQRVGHRLPVAACRRPRPPRRSAGRAGTHVLDDADDPLAAEPPAIPACSATSTRPGRGVVTTTSSPPAPGAAGDGHIACTRREVHQQHIQVAPEHIGRTAAHGAGSAAQRQARCPSRACRWRSRRPRARIKVMIICSTWVAGLVTPSIRGTECP